MAAVAAAGAAAAGRQRRLSLELNDWRNGIGLIGTGMVLQDNGADDLPIVANGGFTFKTAVSGAYAVTVQTQPTSPAQTCSVSNGTGTATANVTNVVINCGTTGLTIGGSVSGLIGSGLVLQNNGGNNLPVSGKGNVPFTFSAPVTCRHRLCRHHSDPAS